MSLFLTTTGSLLQMQASVATTIHVQAAYADNPNGTQTVNPGYQNTVISNTALTTVVSAPAATTSRSVTLTAVNAGATATTVTFTHTDGTTPVEIWQTPLAPGEKTQLTWNGWSILDINGAIKTIPASPAMAIGTPFSSGTAYTVTGGWNQHIRVSSTTAGAKTVTLPAATGSGYVIEIEDFGAMAANPANNITISGTTINGLAIISTAAQLLAFRDVGAGQISSI